LEDKDLIKLYKSGQQAVMEILVERYKNPLYKLCYHLASNRYDTDDLFQETWVRVVKNINSYDEDKPLLHGSIQYVQIYIRINIALKSDG